MTTGFSSSKKETEAAASGDQQQEMALVRVNGYPDRDLFCLYLELWRRIAMTTTTLQADS